MVDLPYRAILFDLDGTLTDPAEGITRCISYGLAQVGVSVPDMAMLRRWIGPPLRTSFGDYLGDEALVERVLSHFRERFSAVGMYENQVYAGIPDLLGELNGAGCRLLLATSKPQVFAERILEHFDLRRYFAAVGGASFDDRVGTKAEVIGTLLPQMSSAERAACVMVGDHDVDVVGARAHDIPCIAVSWGFGSREELQAVAPARLVGSVGELRAVLVGG